MLEVGYRGLDAAGRSPSVALWGEIPVEQYLNGRQGIGLFDDFVGKLGQYDTLAGTGCTTGIEADVQYGAVELDFDGTANDECSLQTDGASFWIDTSPNQVLGFEARVRKSNIADNVLGLFLGLADAGQAATGTLVDTTGALETGTTNFVGFHVAMGTSGATCNFVWKATGQSAVTGLAAAHTFVADTWVKLGFLFDPTEKDAAKRLKIFVNGTLQSTYGTDTQLAANTFPDNTSLAPIYHGKIGSGAAAASAQMDWWQIIAGDSQ